MNARWTAAQNAMVTRSTYCPGVGNGDTGGVGSGEQGDVGKGEQVGQGHGHARGVRVGRGVCVGD